MTDPDLVVLLEARYAAFERQMKSAGLIAERNFGRIEKRSKQASTAIERNFAGVGRGIAAGLASAVSLRASQQLIDSSIRITNSLKVAGLAGDDLNKVYKNLFASAQRNAAPLESLAQLYSSVSLAQDDLGASTDDMLSFTDNVALALRVAGADAQSASGALMQLSQAMGGGVVRAEEFNSILEGARPIAQAAAAGLAEAGGSVSKLRQLVVDGKISSKAFFDAFEAGSVTLRDKVAGSEMTVSASFVRMQNVLTDAAGKFNETSGAGQRFANFLDTLGGKITNLVNSPGFDSALNAIGDAAAQSWAEDMKTLGQVMALAEELAGKFDKFGASVSDAELELAQAEQAVANLAQNTKGQFGEVDAAFQDLVQQLLEGRGTAETAADAIAALGEANPDFSSLQDNIASVIGSFIALRDAAVAAHAAAAQTDPVESGASWGEFSATFAPATPVEPVTLADYPVTPRGGSGGGAGGRGGSAGSRRAEVDAAKELITELENELRLLGLSDVEKRVDAELRRAGASATDAQKASIRELVTAIETEQAAMDQMQTTMEGAKGMAKDFLGGLLGDLRSGVDGATALANAFGRLADKLLDMALDSVINSLFEGLMSGGGGGFLGGLFGFSEGGVVEAATGGHIRGPGTGTSDSIPARLSNGEFVINAAATKRNLDLLHAINRGEVAAFATGGLVGGGPAVRAANENIASANDNAAPVFTINAPITVEGSSGTPEQNADLAKRMRREFEAGMRGVMADELRKQMRAGNTLNTRSR